MAELQIRCDPIADAGLIELVATEASAAWIGPVLGVSLTDTPNVSVVGDGLRADWLGPWRWLLRSPPGSEGALIERLDCAAADREAGGYLAVVVSDAWQGFALTGMGALERLSEGCPLDLEALADTAELRCARTVLARVPVLIAMPEDRDGYLVWVDRAYAGYLSEWLAR